MIVKLPVQAGGLELVTQLAPFVAIGIGGYWLFLLYRRLFRSSRDPSYRKFSSSQVGSASFVVSGAYLSAAFAATIAVLTWPFALEQPLVAVALLGGVVAHSAIEYTEAA